MLKNLSLSINIWKTNKVISFKLIKANNFYMKEKNRKTYSIREKPLRNRK